jgi:soluble lytic murein transglycosylase
MAQTNDPAARKLVLWALVDSGGASLTFSQIDQARRDFAGWPRANRRQSAAERALGMSSLGPQGVVDWFAGAEPVSVDGAMTLASAYEQLNRRQDAQDLIRRWWRGKPFDLAAQTAMQTRFSDLLSPDDIAARADMLLYGSQGPAARALLPLLSADQQTIARARMELREGSYGAPALVNSLPQTLASDPGMIVERARYLEKRGLETMAFELVPMFPAHPPSDEAASFIWTVRKPLVNAAMRAGDFRQAYAAANNSGLTTGTDLTEAEFYAGWIALSKLHDPVEADRHFAEIERAGATPITQSRAYYWRGRAAEARGDTEAAQGFYASGAKYQTAFYGQLSAEKAGLHTLSIGTDPVITPEKRKHFENSDVARATRLLAQIGDRELFKTFVLGIAESPPDAAGCALDVDMARTYGDQDLGMRTVRACAQHGVTLPERGYPLRTAPVSPEAAEAAIVFGVTRQVSGFDPRVRSGPGARGMMQLMPTTAALVARRIGEPYRPGMLDDADYNMRLGASYLGQMVNTFSGSYVMAAAAYNAGPGRPAGWVSYCGDPRTSSGDPVDFIECIPISETRNYVMRVLEATEVYRARINGGSAPIRLTADLKRGGYSYGSGTPGITFIPTMTAANGGATTTAKASATLSQSDASRAALQQLLDSSLNR